jgi:serine/threonine-protein kinase
MAAPGQILAGRYRLERLLARGGHGAVFVAEQLATEARVAVKVLLPHVLDDEEALRRFELEAKVAGRIASEYIVRTLDAGVDPSSGLPFIAMELLEGCSLSEAVRLEGPCSAGDTTTYILQVAHALDKAHGMRGDNGQTRAIVHRDLKPENLFLTTREDGQRVVKILDFGTAKVVSESIARSRSIQGSPLYIAYEQLSGGVVSPKTDVWALGLIAFFLLTGKPYWKAAHPSSGGVSAIFAEILHMPIVPPSMRARELGVEPSWPASFDAWFQRCVARAMQARFGSAGEAAHALLEALLGAGGSSADGLDPGSLADQPDLAARAGIPRRGARSRTLLAGVISVAGLLALVLGQFSFSGTARHAALRTSARGVRTSLPEVAATTVRLAEHAPSPAPQPPISKPTTERVHRVNSARVTAPARLEPTLATRRGAAQPASDEQPSHILYSPIYSER